MKQDLTSYVEKPKSPMDFFFHPDGIAVVGASDNQARGGYYILSNILAGYKGRVYPVNPKYTSLQGLACYPDIKSIPASFDLLIYFAPAKFLPDTIEQCRGKGVRAIIIESAGFAEVGTEGDKLQQKTNELARKYGIRLWGPNCMGLLDGHSRHVFSFMSWKEWKEYLRAGNVSLIVQSGMLSAGFLMMILERGGMGISKVCSIGNKCDVNEVDLLEYLIDDPDTEVIGLYLESIVDGKRFLELARSTSKPVVVLKGGRSIYGAKAAVSHTASMAGNNAIVASAFRQAGIISVLDVNELMDFLRGFSKTRKWEEKGGTAIVTFSGGGGIVTADFLYESGLELAHLSQTTLDKINDVFPEWMEPSNPVDIWPAVEKNGPRKVYSAVIDALFRDPGVNSLILHLFAMTNIDPGYINALSRLKDVFGKPVVAWLVGIGSAYGETRRALEESGIPVFTEIGRAVSVLAGIKRHYTKEQAS